MLGGIKAILFQKQETGSWNIISSSPCCWEKKPLHIGASVRVVGGWKRDKKPDEWGVSICRFFFFIYFFSFSHSITFPHPPHSHTHTHLYFSLTSHPPSCMRLLTLICFPIIQDLVLWSRARCEAGVKMTISQSRKSPPQLSYREPLGRVACFNGAGSLSGI